MSYSYVGCDVVHTATRRASAKQLRQPSVAANFADINDTTRRRLLASTVSGQWIPYLQL